MIHVIKQMNLMYTTTMQVIEFAFWFYQDLRDAKAENSRFECHCDVQMFTTTQPALGIY